MSYYECKRCNQRFNRKSDIKKHLERKKKCPRNIESYKYTEEEISNISLTLVDIKPTIEFVEKKFKCEYCNKLFTRADNLERHKNKVCKNSNDFKNNTINNVENKTMIIENQNNTNIENQNNIIIINQPQLKPFDTEWTIEHIDNYLRQIILLSENKYTNLLDEILKNKQNLNVIIEKETDSALVYKNETDLYVTMKIKEIVDKSMQKLYEQLNGFYTNLIDSTLSKKINLNIIDKEKKILDNKFEDYCKDDSIKDIVSTIFTNMYEKNKFDAIEISEKILSNNKKIGY